MIFNNYSHFPFLLYRYLLIHAPIGDEGLSRIVRGCQGCPGFFGFRPLRLPDFHFKAAGF